MQVQRLKLPPERAGERLDRVLAELLGQVSRTHVKYLVKDGAVTLDGAVCERPGHRVEGGEEVVVELRERVREHTLTTDATQLRVVHQDEHLIVIHKPPQVVVHPTGGLHSNTISEQAVARFGPLPTLQGEDRPGIVHRLDAATSGVMVLGRTEAAFESLMSQFRQRKVTKTYLALVYGVPRFNSGWIEGPIGRSPRDPGRFAVVAEGTGREASTYWEVAERYDGLALLRCHPKTGRTHQIRVHLASIEHHIVADALYKRRGGPAVVLPAEAPIPERQCLHALAIEFEHPGTHQTVRYEVPLEDDIAAMVDWLRENR